MFCPPYYRRREFEKSNIDVCTPCEKEGGGAETADGNFHGRMAIACCFETRLCPNKTSYSWRPELRKYMSREKG